jgi:S1-C subfamily serine protease
MRNLSLAVVSLALFASSARADDAIPPEMLTTIKAATVFVKVKVEGLSGSGSGFVIKSDGNSAYVVTNHHVIEPKAVRLILVPGYRPAVPYNRSRGSRRPYSPMPPQMTSPNYTLRVMVRSFKNAAVTVVFNSGTEKEQSIPAEILAADPEQDLAVLKVSGVKQLPKPIDCLHEPKLTETMPIYTFGFPFGDVLATSKGGPAITVGKGSVSSLRRDDDGNLVRVQIDGALNPGNSGGPVVDAQGRLVGVAVATIRESSGIGLAIPCRELTRTLDGRLGKVYLHGTTDQEGLVTVHVEVGLIDPLDKIKSAAFHYLSANSLKDKPKPTDPLEPLPGCRKVSLKLEKHLATGEFTLERGVTQVSLLHQAVYVNESGKAGLTNNMAETVRVSPAAVAGAPGGNVAGPDSRSKWPSHPRPGGRASREPQILGGGGDPQFKDAAPEKGLLAGFEVGLGKWANNDVVCAIRPIFLSAQGKEVLGQQHGADTSRPVRVRAKQGYAVAAITAKSALVVDGFSVTFMRIDKDRLNPKDSYESDWIGGKGGGPQTRLGGDGAPVIGIVGRENSKDCTGLGLLQAPAEPGGPATTPPPVVAALEGAPPMHYRSGPTMPPPGIAALDQDRVTRSLPEPIDDVVAGGAGRYLLFHSPKLRKLAIFDVAQAKITHYVPLNSDDVLYAAGSQKLIVVVRDQNVIQRYDLATLQKELTVSLPEVGEVNGLVLGYASAGPALLTASSGTRFIDVAKLSLVEPASDVRGGDWRGRMQVRASADGSTFAAWATGLSPSGINILTLEGDTAQYRYEHTSAGVLLPSYDGALLFTGAGIYSADLKPVSPEEFRGILCFPSYHPAYFLGYGGQNRFYNPIGGRIRINNSNREEKAKLSLYTSGDRRLLVSFTDFDELNEPQESPINSNGFMSIDKRIHFFPTANLLVTIPAARDRLVLRRLDVTAALEKAGIDYLYVASLPPATAAPGSTLSYAIAVQSRRGGVHCTLDSGPDGMTLSDDGKLKWSVPAAEPLGRQGVIITIKDASGQEILHSFNITIR